MAKKKKKGKDKVPEITSGLYERKTLQTPKKDETTTSTVRKRCPKCAKILPSATGKCQRCRV